MAHLYGRSAMNRWVRATTLTLIALTVIGARGCNDEDDGQPAQPPPAPVIIRVDPPASLAGFPAGTDPDHVRECLEATQGWAEELLRTLGWSMDGKTLTITLAPLGPGVGAETTPDPADPAGIVIKLNPRVCEWLEARRRRVLAHELDHARNMDDPANGDGTKSRRQLRAEMEAADRALRNQPPDASAAERLRALLEQLRTQIAYLEAQIREETRAYGAADDYAEDVGLPDEELEENRREGERAIEELRREVARLRAMLDRYD